MSNIWDVLAFTLCFSFTGMLLLLFKYLFRDKLSARWHYFVWGVLLLRAIIPPELRLVCFEGAVNGVWLEKIQRLRLYTERGLESILSQPFGRKGLAFPALFQMPPGQWSWTDAVFLLYLIGVAAVLLYDMVVYVMLRRQVMRGKSAPPALQEKAEEAAARCGMAKYGEIRVCRGIGTPFVCGLLRPVMAVPEEMAETVDGKILMHEMMHMRYHDVLVNFLLHFLAALNWFNPLAYWLCRVIRNDSEALCDQRVLEMLEGQERKAYGYLLLEMADSRHSYRIGTTSMANGARNIKTRIRRIADFGRTPKGASFAAACITVLLCLFAIGFEVEPKYFDTSGIASPQELEAVLEEAKFFHVASPEMAVNIYKEALQEEDLVKMALVVPEDCFGEFKEWAMGRCTFRNGGIAWEDAYGDYAYALHDNQGRAEYLDLSFFSYQKEEACTGQLRVSLLVSDGENPQMEPLTYFRLEKEGERNWSLRVTGKGEIRSDEDPDGRIGSWGRETGFKEAREMPAEMKQYGDWRYQESFICGSREPFDTWENFWNEDEIKKFSEELDLHTGTRVWLDYAGDPAELQERYGQEMIFCMCSPETPDEDFLHADVQGNLDLRGRGSSSEGRYCYQALLLDGCWAENGRYLDELRKTGKGLYLETPTNWFRHEDVTTLEEGMELVGSACELRIYGTAGNEPKRMLTIPLEGLMVYEGND